MSDAPHPVEVHEPYPPALRAESHIYPTFASTFVPAVTRTVEPITPIAPLWHTACVLLMLGLLAVLSGERRHSYEAGPHVATYLSQIMLSWMLFGSVIAGVTDRRAFFLHTIGDKLRNWHGDALRGAVVYAGIYGTIVGLAMIGAIGTLAYQTLHHKSPATQATTSSSNSPSTPVPPPPTANPDPLAQFKNSHFHFDSKTVLALAPRTPLELLLWVVISITAGFSEEHIFRGYLLTQARAYTRLWGLSPGFATTLAVLLVSLIFGSLHLYEGLGGAAVITCLGAVYAVVTIKLRNLRAVIVAHFLQDLIAGIMLFFLHAFYSRLLPS